MPNGDVLRTKAPSIKKLGFFFFHCLHSCRGIMEKGGSSFVSENIGINGPLMSSFFRGYLPCSFNCRFLSFWFGLGGPLMIYFCESQAHHCLLFSWLITEQKGVALACGGQNTI